MTKKDRAALCDYIGLVADQMELRDWHLNLDEESCSNDAWASCRPIYGKRVAYISVCEEFRTLDADTQRECVVHELIHCHLAQTQCQIEHDLEPHLAPAVDKAIFDSFQRNVEHAVDALAKALSPRFPVIEWPT